MQDKLYLYCHECMIGLQSWERDYVYDLDRIAHWRLEYISWTMLRQLLNG